MPSIFEEITKTVVRELDSGGNTIAVRSAIDADRFHCFCLVREKRSLFGSWYCKTDLTLKDILESENGERPIDEVDSVSPGQKAEFRISDDVDSKGEFSVKLPKTITSRGMAGWSQGTQGQEIKILVNRIPQQYLDSLVDRKLKKKLPRIFELVQARGEHLYLVTEALVTVNEETLRRERQFEFNSWMDRNIFSFAYKHQTSVTIPSQRVLGYRIMRLPFPNPEKRKRDGGPSHIGRSLSLEDFRNMKEKVQDLRRSLQDLTKQERTDVLSCFSKFQGNDGHLQDLEERVSEVLVSGELQMENPAGPLISSLFNAAGILVEARADAIQALLDALMELSEEYQQLVFEALEKGMLPQLVEKVESTLEKKWDERYSNPHDMDSDSEAQSLYALYVALSILLQLCEKPTSASS
ncbi:gasdermin-B isoform X2 [Elephas maximus indicus]|uniref:gasdermin-B isoform X2 n=1 Tax=Elephas maximus indicus TaxID=99487 RepID=UPI002116ACA6|nr:gasdermin-B isoform X2 [Elephas maximus indicus]